MHYAGLDIHKKTISFCIRTADGQIADEGVFAANKTALSEWLRSLPVRCMAGMEATMFTGWVFDHLDASGMTVKVAHPAMLQAIFAGKRKNDTLDARKLADLLRCDYFPECHMVSRDLRDRRRALRYRNLVVRQTVRMKNRMSALMMETGLQYNKKKLHQKRYFQEMLEALRPEMPDSLPDLLGYNRSAIEFLWSIDKQLVQTLRHDSLIRERVERLTSIPGVGPIVALTWVLEIGEVDRFPSIKKVISYCGLCGAEISSAGKQQRSPISKQRNKHLQTVLVEAAKLAPRYHPELATLYEREKQRGNRNRATLAVARKLTSYLLAVDRAQRPFQKSYPVKAAEAA
jgi:transposase